MLHRQRQVLKMGWGLSSWLILVRLFQLIGMFVSGAMNGWLVYYIYTNALGLSDRMVIIEILVCLSVILHRIPHDRIPTYHLTLNFDMPYATVLHNVLIISSGCCRVRLHLAQSISDTHRPAFQKYTMAHLQHLHGCHVSMSCYCYHFNFGIHGCSVELLWTDKIGLYVPHFQRLASA